MFNSKLPSQNCLCSIPWVFICCAIIFICFRLFFILFLIASLIHLFFMSMFFNPHILGNISALLLVLISNFISLWSENKPMISIFFSPRLTPLSLQLSEIYHWFSWVFSLQATSHETSQPPQMYESSPYNKLHMHIFTIGFISLKNSD